MCDVGIPVLAQPVSVSAHPFAPAMVHSTWVLFSAAIGTVESQLPTRVGIIWDSIRVPMPGPLN